MSDCLNPVCGKSASFVGDISSKATLQVDVQLALDAEEHAVTITTQAQCTAQTGVEMEALTAAAVAALTV